MKRKIISVVLFFSLMIGILILGFAGIEATDSYRQLLDIQIFRDTPLNGWADSGGNELETDNGTLPMDWNEMYNDLPSLRINVTEEVTSGWWVSSSAINNWCTIDLSQYIESGYLEFNIKGEKGGETFLVGARDEVKERAGLPQELELLESISEYCEVTTKWQSVKIPLKDIMDSEKGFEAEKAKSIIFAKETSDPMKVWINNVRITSKDDEKSAPAIKVNQVGFIPNGDKYALVTGFAEELEADEGSIFYVKNSSDDKVVYEGSLELISEFEAIDSGEKILKADFTELTKEGVYYISVDSVEENSPAFSIEEGVYSDILIDTSRYYYYQRQGIDLEEKYANYYSRSDLTPEDKQAVFATGTKEPIDVTKGWYDAGDSGKYVNAGATAVSDLLWAYEMFPDQFGDNHLNIPESNNGIPDILDEIRWELEWMLKMQDSNSGGFYPRVQYQGEQRVIMDQNGCTTDDTASAIGALGHAYVVYKDFDESFANECLESAKKGWVFLQNNQYNIASPDGPYTVYNDKADRLWASSSLFRATGESEYNDYFRENYKDFEYAFTDQYSYAHSWGNMWLTAYLCYLASDNADKDIVNWTENMFDKWLDKTIETVENNPWNNVVMSGNYFWGINMQILNTSMDAYIGSQLLGKYDEKVEEIAYNALNWILGTNPLRYSFVSGYGEDCTTEIFSEIYDSDGKEGIPNGYMPGGPNVYQGAGLSNFAAKCYSMSNGDWETNEHTIYWNSPLVFMSAFGNSK